MNIVSELHRLRQKGVPRSVAAELLGMGYGRFKRLIKLHGIDWPKYINAKRFTLGGFTGTIGQHAARLGISEHAAEWRIRRESRDTRPSRITDECVTAFVELRRQGVPALVASSRIGHSYDRLHKRALQAYSDEYRAIVAACRADRCNAFEAACRGCGSTICATRSALTRQRQACRCARLPICSGTSPCSQRSATSTS